MHLADAFIQSDLQCIQTIHVFVSMCVPWESNPQPFALLTQCSTTEPHRNTFSTMSLTMSRIQRSWKQLAWTFVCVCVCMCVSVFVCPHLTRRLCFSMPSCLGLSANLIWHWRPTAHRSGVLGVCVCVCVCLTALIFVGVCGIILVCECLKADSCLCWQGVINRDGSVKQRMLHTWQD